MCSLSRKSDRFTPAGEFECVGMSASPEVLKLAIDKTESVPLYHRLLCIESLSSHFLSHIRPEAVS
jgi:hypothetical protein